VSLVCKELHTFRVGRGGAILRSRILERLIICDPEGCKSSVLATQRFERNVGKALWVVVQFEIDRGGEVSGPVGNCRHASPHSYCFQ
jgi:hypothetical protein